MVKHRDSAARLLAAALAIAGGATSLALSAQDKPPGTDVGRRPQASRYSRSSEVTSVRARPGFTELLQPSHSVRVNVHYPETYGYVTSAGAFGGSGPFSCDAFSVSVVSTVIPTHMMRFDNATVMHLSAGEYICQYTQEDLLLNVPIDVHVAMADSSALQTEAWLGGSESKPPQGQHRAIDASHFQGCWRHGSEGEMRCDWNGTRE